MISALPLQAAGPSLSGNTAKTKTYLCDIFISSYTPTLTALIEARSGTSSLEKSLTPELLAVAQFDDSLRKVEEELTTLRSIGTNVSLLLNEHATRDAILEQMKRRHWVHFACHGTLKEGQPFNSAFILANNDRLTLLDLIKSHLPNAEFAFLSACHTAEQTTGSASEEVLHLAAAMQFSGFRSVVGTMWQMVDADGPEIARHFYKEMFSHTKEPCAPELGFKQSARALYSATKKLRRKRVDLERWVNFVHIGA